MNPFRRAWSRQAPLSPFPVEPPWVSAEFGGQGMPMEISKSCELEVSEVTGGLPQFYVFFGFSPYKFIQLLGYPHWTPFFLPHPPGEGWAPPDFNPQGAEFQRCQTTEESEKYELLWKWWFPKIEVSPNHPFKDGLSIINHPFGVPPF